MADVRPLHARAPGVTGPDGATGVIVFGDGRLIWGQGFGAEGEVEDSEGRLQDERPKRHTFELDWD